MTQNIGLLRHGVAEYKTLKVSCPRKIYRNDNIDQFIQFANSVRDLKDENIVDLQNNIKDFFQMYEQELKSKEIIIWVSPFGRTLQTAAELVKFLGNNSYNLKKVSIFDQLREVDDFERSLFSACVNGGNVEIEGEKIILDKTQTNPNNLNYTDYFFKGEYRKLGSLHEKFGKIETYNEITKRSRETLKRALSAVNTNTFLIMVTHQAWTDHVMVEKNGYKNGGLEPGKILLYPHI